MKHDKTRQDKTRQGKTRKDNTKQTSISMNEKFGGKGIKVRDFLKHVNQTFIVRHESFA